ncbi:MAG: zinc ribbon domain-containing protein [Gemmatimonadota bacterium]
MSGDVPSPASCPSCGAEVSGKFCSRCGTRLGGGSRHCSHCGGRLAAGALYCSGCGSPVAARPRKPWAARLPWLLSGLALACFAIAIAIFVQEKSVPRAAVGPPGGESPAGSASPSVGDAGAGGMPSAAELAAMSPREAADRLFDRAMREKEGGDTTRAHFFARMALEAYGRVPAVEVDPDLRFHLGMLDLLLGRSAAARAQADTVLAARRTQLFGLILAARAAAADGDETTAASFYAKLREAIAGGESPDAPEYEAHRAFIDQEAEQAGPNRELDP